MKKAIVILLSVTMLLSASACSSNRESSQSVSSEIVQTAEPIKLDNKMTENELSRVDKHALTLLDEPANIEDTEHKVSIEFVTQTPEDMFANLENMRDKLTDDEYEQAIEEINHMAESGEIESRVYVLIDGFYYSDLIWFPENDDKGASITIYGGETDEYENITFDTFEEYLDWVAKDYKKNGLSDDMIESKIRQIQMVRDALKSGDYETLPEGSIDPNDPSMYSDSFADPFADYRNTWEYDRTAVEAIKDSIDEISIYDEELNTEFLVHVTLPPDYDESKTYPVFFLTDGIWRFGNHPELRKLMENSEASPVILVSMWYSYNTPYDGGNTRYYDLVINRDKLLNFVTDNLMPYLTENYNIDCANSTLYGHSDGGVFTHYALFNSDKFDNQPFGHYIIGSPALWGLYNYNDSENISSDDVLNDYGYFDRNEKLSKSVFLCAGSQEDPDYADNYNGHDTTLEGTAKLKERLEAHGANLTYKLYDSHHYQYIPEMLIEFLKETYPKQ